MTGDNYMLRDKPKWLRKSDYKKDYHQYTGVPKTYEIVLAFEYEEDGIEVLEWSDRFTNG